MEILMTALPELTICTSDIQKAIDQCHALGGGTVRFSKGQYLTGTVFFKSNVRLYLDRGAEILGSTDPSDYPIDVYKQMYTGETHMDRCLFFASGCENIELDGHGVINGQGAALEAVRPMLFRYYQSKNIRIKNLKLIAPASWTNAFIECENIWVTGIDIYSRANKNGDGVDFDACQNVFVSDCKFDCSDDCICLQNSTLDRPCQDIVVQNCLFKSKWAGMRIGLLSCAPIRNLTVSNCIFREIDCSGLKIQSAEGSIIENMTFTNLIMENVVRPIFITANQFRERTDWDDAITTPSVLQNLKFSHIISRTVDPAFLAGKESQPNCVVIDAAPGQIIDRISITDMQLTLLAQDADVDRDIPHHLGCRAEGRNYLGLLPAHGLFARGVQNLKLQDFDVCMSGEDKREKIVTL